MKIRPLHSEEKSPMSLLLLADPSEKLVKEYLTRGRCYIMEVQGETLGTYVLLPTRPDTIELVNVAIREDQQGKGFGKELILHAISAAKEANYKTIEVGTGNSSIAQLALYQKCGFRMTHIDQNFFTRHYDSPIFENGIQCVDMVRLSQDL